MLSVIGHQALRAALAHHTGSYALLGPPGVGKRVLVGEWLGDRPSGPCPHDPAPRAVQRPSLIQVIDAAHVGEWTSWLRPLEEQAVTVVVLSDTLLPAAVTSRLPVFRAGYLTESEVTQILAARYPRVAPRPVVATLAAGSLDNLDLLTETAQTLPLLDRALSEGTYPDLRTLNPVALLHGLRAIARSVLGLRSVTVSDPARAALSRTQAAQILMGPVPVSKHEARNLLVLILAGLRG